MPLTLKQVAECVSLSSLCIKRLVERRLFPQPIIVFGQERWPIEALREWVRQKVLDERGHVDEAALECFPMLESLDRVMRRTHRSRSTINRRLKSIPLLVSIDAKGRRRVSRCAFLKSEVDRELDRRDEVDE